MPGQSKFCLPAAKLGGSPQYATSPWTLLERSPASKWSPSLHSEALSHLKNRNPQSWIPNLHRFTGCNLESPGQVATAAAFRLSLKMCWKYRPARVLAGLFRQGLCRQICRLVRMISATIRYWETSTFVFLSLRNTRVFVVKILPTSIPDTIESETPVCLKLDHGS